MVHLRHSCFLGNIVRDQNGAGLVQVGKKKSAKLRKLDPQGGDDSRVRKDVMFGSDLSLFLYSEEDGTTQGTQQIALDENNTLCYSAVPVCEGYVCH